MKELLKSMWNALKTVLFIPQISKEDLLITLYYPILAFKLWCLNLALFFSFFIVLLLFVFLSGEWQYLTKTDDFIRFYFYDEYLLNFPMWKLHVVLYFCCLLIAFRAD